MDTTVQKHGWSPVPGRTQTERAARPNCLTLVPKRPVAVRWSRRVHSVGGIYCPAFRTRRRKDAARTRFRHRPNEIPQSPSILTYAGRKCFDGARRAFIPTAYNIYIYIDFVYATNSAFAEPTIRNAYFYFVRSSAPQWRKTLGKGRFGFSHTSLKRIINVTSIGRNGAPHSPRRTTDDVRYRQLSTVSAG